MASLHFEGAVRAPEIDTVADTRYTTLVDYLCSLCTGNVELKIGIFLPEAEEERELSKESIEDRAIGGDCLWARVAVQTALLLLSERDGLLPCLELVRHSELIDGVSVRTVTR